MDRLVKRYELQAVDADRVESPSIAVRAVEQALITPLNYFPGLLELIHKCGATYWSCYDRYYRDNILKEVESGRWLLIRRQPIRPWSLERRPFAGGYSGQAVAPAPAASPISEEPLRREPPPKLRIALRLGVFFDGTHNNAANSAQGQLCGAQHPITEEDLDPSCKPYMRDPESSYGNGVTNIKLLHDLYPNTPSLPANGGVNQGHRGIYIEGIGTRASEQDSLFGGGSAPGLQLYLSPEHFPTVVHLVARDEYRANFALDS